MKTYNFPLIISNRERIKNNNFPLMTKLKKSLSKRVMIKNNELPKVILKNPLRKRVNPI